MIRFLVVIFCYLLCSCSTVNQNSASLSFRATGNKDSFIFTVNEKFLAQNSDSKVHKQHTKLSEAEFKLLLSMLKQHKYCLNSKGKYDFTIDSRQEKIFDSTYSQLIARTYNAKPISPISYYGKCNN